MANSSSIIRVSIIGDADKLTAALGEAETKVGGLIKKIGIGLVALKAGGELADFLGDSVQEADRLEDATTRLNLQLGKLAGNLIAGAGGDFFLSMGLSPQDVLEMEARFADLGTAIGLTDTELASTAESVTATAAALALLRDEEPDTLLDLISKAAGGSAKAAKELGVTLLEGATAGEQLTNIMGQLKPTLDEVTGSTGDLERRQGELQARVEKLQGELGGPLTDALSGVLGFILDEIDAIPGAVQGWQNLGAAIENFGREALAPLARLEDMLQNIRNLLRQTSLELGGPLTSTTALNEAIARRAQEDWENRNQGKP